MTKITRLFAAYWPALLALAFIAVLPLRREMEWAVSIFAISLAFLARHPENRELIGRASRIILPIFLCIWIPMLISSMDSLDAYKSWKHTLPSLRFLAAALAIAVLLRDRRLRALLLRSTCWLLLFWAADGYFQLMFGVDVFGVPMSEDRLNALFYSRHGAYGPTLAMLSPLALMHMRDHWRRSAFLAGYAFLLGAVFLSGMRAGWIMFAVVTAAFMWPMLKNQATRKLALALPLIAMGALALATIASPLMQERLKLSALAVLGTEQAIDEASSYRIPIFRSALAMYREHPVNGVGVRAFAKVYMDNAGPDDIHSIRDGTYTRAHQAHNIVLEFMADTGTIGLLGFLAAVVFGVRAWRGLGQERKDQAFPYAVCLLAIIFPLNSFFAIFGVYTMSITWVMMGLFGAAGISGDSEAGKQDSNEGQRDERHRDDEEYPDDVFNH